jgi:hypothetical protein
MNPTAVANFQLRAGHAPNIPDEYVLFHDSYVVARPDSDLHKISIAPPHNHGAGFPLAHSLPWLVYMLNISTSIYFIMCAIHSLSHQARTQPGYNDFELPL